MQRDAAEPKGGDSPDFPQPLSPNSEKFYSALCESLIASLFQSLRQFKNFLGAKRQNSQVGWL